MIIIPNIAGKISTGPSTVTNTISTGMANAYGMALVGTQLYVGCTNITQHSIKIIDTTTNAVVKTISVEGQVRSLTYDGVSKVWITYRNGIYNAARVRTILTSTQAFDNDIFIYPIDTSSAVLAMGSVVMADASTALVTFQDANGNAQIAKSTISSPGFGTKSYMQGSGSLDHALAVFGPVVLKGTLQQNPYFKVFDYNLMGNYGSSTVITGEIGGGFTRWGTRLFVAGWNFAKMYVFTVSGTQGGNTVVSLENTITLNDSLAKTGQWIYTFNDRVYAMSSGNNDISVVDAPSQSLVNTMNLGVATYGMAATPDGTKLFVSSSSNGNVYVIE